MLSRFRVWSSKACERLCAWLDRAGCDQDFEWAGPEAGNNMDEYTDTVSSFIGFYEEVCVLFRSWKSYHNDKPWFSPQLKRLRWEKEAAKCGWDSDLFRQAKYRFGKAVKEAKHHYVERLQQQQLSEGIPPLSGKASRRSPITELSPHRQPPPRPFPPLP